MGATPSLTRDELRKSSRWCSACPDCQPSPGASGGSRTRISAIAAKIGSHSASRKPDSIWTFQTKVGNIGMTSEASIHWRLFCTMAQCGRDASGIAGRRAPSSKHR
jgi:hypothetical protein